jgi:hypothetical protein
MIDQMFTEEYLNSLEMNSPEGVCLLQPPLEWNSVTAPLTLENSQNILFTPTLQ